MPSYVLLMSWNESGVESAIGEGARKDGKMILGINERLDQKLGPFNGGVTEFLWTLGTYDMVAIVEADSDVSVAGVALWLAREHGVRTTTMRAYNSNEIGLGSAPAQGTVAGVLYRCYADDAGAGDGG